MYGVIDIGSNTIRMVIYKLENGSLRRIMSKKDSAGLAACVSDKNALTDEGMEKAAAVISDFLHTAECITPLELFPFATASLRNVANTDQVLEFLRKRCGVDVRILTGREEALFSYSGACGSFISDGSQGEGSAVSPVPSPSDGILADVGGGSTEIVCCKDGEIVSAGSIPFGSLNTYSKYVSRILPDENERRTLRRKVRGALENVSLPEEMPSSDTLILVGGSARGALGLYNRDMGASGDSFPLKYLKEKTSENQDKLERDILRVAPDRIHTLVPGMLIIKEVARITGCKNAKVSPYGVREGYLYNILHGRGVI